MGSLHSPLRDINGSVSFPWDKLKNPNILINSSSLTKKGHWEWPWDDTNSSEPHLDLSRTDVKLFQDIYQEVLDFNPRINAIGSIQNDDDVHVGLASCGKSRDLLKVLLQRGRFMASLPARYFLSGFLGGKNLISIIWERILGSSKVGRSHRNPLRCEKMGSLPRNNTQRHHLGFNFGI